MRLEELERLNAYREWRTSRREFVLASGAAALLIAGCGGSDSNGGDSGLGDLTDAASGGGKPVDTVNWGIVADPLGLDPIGVNDYQSVQPMYQAFDTVVQLNEENGISPMLAEKWDAPDPTTYIYDIRSDVTFQDGSPMTVEDVAYSINRHVDPKNGSALIDFVSSVKSIETNGNNQVIIKLSEPNAMFKYVLALPVGMVVSQRNIEDLLAKGGDIGTPSALPIGTGAFRYAEWDRGQTVRMERYDGYWDTEKALQVKNLVFQVIPDAEALATGMLDGSIQGTFQLNGQQIAPLADEVQILRSESVNLRIAAMNCAKAPFDDPRVRQALSMAIDKAGLLESAYVGEGKLWNSPVMENQWQFSEDVFQEAYDALPDFTTRDLEEAKQLIADAGAEGAEGNIIASSTEQQAQAVAVQAAGEEIGLKLSIDRVSGDELLGLLFPEKFPGEWSVACWDWGSDTPDPSSDLIIPFLSENLSNFTQYKNPKVDKLLVQQREMEDDDARAEVLAEIQAQIVEDQPWSVLYWINQLTALSNDIGGLSPIPTWAYQHWAADLSGN